MESPSEAVVCGIGDDAAVLPADGDRCLLITTDTLTEGRHFTRAGISPYLLGKKALAVNLSDIAAMGGEPLAYVVALAAPPEMPAALITALYRGMRARAAGVPLVGGDTVADPERLTLTITLLGTAPATQVVYRSGARAGDAIYVTGTVGDAALGLARCGRAAARRSFLVRRHCDPTPRLTAGRALARQGLATSMIDISDGLVADLRHVLTASGVGARVEVDWLPLSRAYRRECRERPDFYRPALSGGEDYELLFTAAPAAAARIAALAARLAVPMTRVGSVTDTAGQLVVCDGAGQCVPVDAGGYRHF